MPRFRVRTLMIAVAVVALFLGSIGPGRRWYRRWSYHHAQAVMYARAEATELRNNARERRAAADKAAIRTGLMKTPDFAARGADEQERLIANVVAFHQQQAVQSRAAARSWSEKRRDSETAAFWAFDPFAPDVP